MARQTYIPPNTARSAAISVERMRTLLVCRGPIAFETLAVYRRCHWQLPHIVVSAREWTAERQRTAPWLVDMPPDHVHYVQEYDDVEAVLQIAQEHWIDAIYPGYGFLAESAPFAARVQQAGLRFIGPTPEMLRAVGDKDAAIRLAKRLRIPTIPGDDTLIAFAHTHSDEDVVIETVQRILALMRQYPGKPIRLKHPAGGGGKGQRVLTIRELQTSEVAELVRHALVKIWAEIGVSSVDAVARKGVLLEVNIPRPLHWEVQLLGDGDTVVHFAARDCSLQNHAAQKFIELALSPQVLTRELQRLHAQQDAARIATLCQRLDTLEEMCAAATRLGQDIRLCGVATVEFLIDQQGSLYFLEVNPRIQVEHAVTEGIARVRGQPISLVELQQRVAAGEKLSFRQTDITYEGDALEVRLNAWHEDLSPVLGGTIHALRFDVPPALQDSVHLEAGGLQQRHEPWDVPSYDANFALLVVSGSQRSETLARMITILKTALQVEGNAILGTNLQPVLGLLTLMQHLPPGTEVRTDTSLLWMACTAMVVAQKHTLLSLVPSFPRRPEFYDPARFARLLRATLEACMEHPSCLLTYYVERLTDSAQRPLTGLQVLWQLAERLAVPLFEEEYQQLAALQEAITTLWIALSASPQRYMALVRAAATEDLEHNVDYHVLYTSLQARAPELGLEEATTLLHALLVWLSTDVPAVTALIKSVESTQLHSCLSTYDAVSLPYPAFMEDEVWVARLHRLLSSSLRPAVLRDGELCAPMEATIFLHPGPDASPFVQIGTEVRVGQTLALLEAMKMFTELASPLDGVVVDIFVVHGQSVQRGTPLLKIATEDIAVERADEIVQHIAAVPFHNRFDLLLPLALPQVSRALPEHGLSQPACTACGRRGHLINTCLGVVAH